MNEIFSNIIKNYVDLCGKIIPQVIGLFAGIDMISIVKDKIKLQRKSNYDGKNIVWDINNNVDELINKCFDYPDEILRILNVFEQKVSPIDLKTALYNLSSLEFKFSIVPLLLGSGGAYNVTKNYIVYSIPYVLEHEFLHMASTIHDKTNNMYLSGFSQHDFKNYNYIGDGINEGYTELLAHRIFGKKAWFSAYLPLVKIVKLIEMFFDSEEEMQHLYFKSDLPSLVLKLENYTTREDAINIISEIDCIHSYTKKPIYGASLIKFSNLQVHLYNIFKENSNDIEKIERFKNEVCKNKLSLILINEQKMKLQKNNIYCNSDKKINKK